MKLPPLTVTLPDGTVARRGTENRYLFAVAALVAPYAGAPGAWTVISWHSSFELACRKAPQVERDLRSCSRLVREVRVLQVDQASIDARLPVFEERARTAVDRSWAAREHLDAGEERCSACLELAPSCRPDGNWSSRAVMYQAQTTRVFCRACFQIGF